MLYNNVIEGLRTQKKHKRKRKYITPSMNDFFDCINEAEAQVENNLFLLQCKRGSNIVILSDEHIKVLCHVYEYGK